MNQIKTLLKSPKHSGFTIVELLVVIVVIGILAAVTAVSYAGVSNKANIAVMQSDLSNSSNQLKMYQATYGSYPTTIDPSTKCPTSPNYDANLCLKTSQNNTYSYTSDGIAFNLIETNANGLSYNVTDNTSVAVYPWYPGIAATVLAGKRVYKTNLSSTYQFRTTATAIASPQGATGLDPNYPSNMSLVSPQTNPGVDFSTYPAQNACKVVGGRLPNAQEMVAIYTGRASYGNNLNFDGYVTATESSATNSYNMNVVGGLWSGSKTSSYYVRCVAD